MSRTTKENKVYYLPRPISINCLVICLCLLFSFACSTADKTGQTLGPPAFADSNTFRLSDPSIQSGEAFFEQTTSLILSHGLGGAQLHFTLDGSDPTSDSPVYLNPVPINKTTEFKVRAFHTNFLESNIISKQFIKLPPPIPVKQIDMNRKPNENYLGKGSKGLIDRQKGSTNFRTHHWMGFNGGDLEIEIELVDPHSLGSLTFSLLSDQGSWIFLPQMITVQASKDGVEYFEVTKQTLEGTAEGAKPKLEFIKIPMRETKTKFLKIRITSEEAIPDWHPGKGTAPWLFIDEMLMESI